MCVQNTQQNQIICTRANNGLYNVYVNNATGKETICEITNGGSGSYRYVLGEKLSGTNNSKILFCIGANPSTADVNPIDGCIRDDQTISKVRNIFVDKRNKFSLGSWQMLNLYPQIFTNINCLPKIRSSIVHLNNMNYFSTIPNNSIVLAAWGGLIEQRAYFKNCLASIVQILDPKKVQWVKLNSLAKHPKHPSRCSQAEQELVDFDINTYLINNKTNAYIILEFLKANPNNQYCDNCLSLLCNGIPVQQVTQICDNCISDKIISQTTLCDGCRSTKLTRKLK